LGEHIPLILRIFPIQPSRVARYPGMLYGRRSPHELPQPPSYLSKSLRCLQRRNICTLGRVLERDSISLTFSESVHPKFRTPVVEVRYVTQGELFKSLSATILGMSSELYTWDRSLERFVLNRTIAGMESLILLDGKDEVATERFHMFSSYSIYCLTFRL
jgi:hypothetical protein